MTNQKNNLVEQFELKRRREIDNLIVAVFVACGINLFVSGIAMIGEERPYHVYIIAGVIATLLAIIIFVTYQFAEMKKRIKISGFFVYDKNKREIICVPRYDISLRMCNNMASASEEIKRIWKLNTIGNIQFISGKLEPEKTEAYNIIEELLEYCVLEILSAILIDYYDRKSGDLKKLQRDDLPDILQNRFLYWFSKEPKNNDEFRNYLEVEGCTFEEAVTKSLMNRKKSKPYHRFEIVLPPKTHIKRDDRYIIIENSLFVLSIKNSFNGGNENVPINFLESYLNLDGFNRDIQAFNISVEIDVKFKIKALISKETSDYFKWIDIFIERLNSIISSDYFFEKIGWYTAETVMKLTEAVRK